MVKGQMDMVEKFAVGLIVNNRFGVLNRIAGLYAKRCYNIDSLSVGETENPEFSRMTIVSTGDEYMKGPGGSSAGKADRRPGGGAFWNRKTRCSPSICLSRCI